MASHAEPQQRCHTILAHQVTQAAKELDRPAVLQRLSGPRAGLDVGFFFVAALEYVHITHGSPG